jgi:catechol 2,3-dioxygenase-like lactoylglutathione lyase family enzyme
MKEQEPMNHLETIAEPVETAAGFVRQDCQCWLAAWAYPRPGAAAECRRPDGRVALRATFSFITLAVDDLDRSVAFYRDGLGWPTDGIVGQEYHDETTGADGTIAFFTLESGLLLGLYERTNLCKDASLPPGARSSTEFSLGIPAGSQAEVDELLKHVERAGGTLTAPAHMRPFGVYSGYFTDPDGHLFEIAWNSSE